MLGVLLLVLGAAAQTPTSTDVATAAPVESYTKKCGISWDSKRNVLLGADGFLFNQGRFNRPVVSTKNQTSLVPFSERSGLKVGDEVISLNGKAFTKLPISQYFSNLQKLNYWIIKRGGKVQMVKFSCPLPSAGRSVASEPTMRLPKPLPPAKFGSYGPKFY